MGLRSKIMHRLGWEKIRHSNRLVNSYEAQKRLLGDAFLIFDVGAYDGRTAKQLRRRFPAAQIHCFEPVPDNFELLASNVAGDPDIHPVPLALSDEEGSASFRQNAFGMTSSLLPNAAEASSWVESESIAPVASLEVRVSTVDGYCAEHAIDAIDLLKVDAQGADLKVLRGAQGMFVSRSIRAVFVEVSLVPLYEGQCQLHEITTLMEGHGYRLFDFFDAHYAENGQLRWADLLFAAS